MASFGETQYGKFLSIQNNSGSADAAAPAGGVYLFASGTVGNTKLYLNKEGSTDAYEVGSADLKIAGDSGTGTVNLGTGQTLTIAGGTGLDTTAADQTITFSVDLNEMGAGAVNVAADSFAFVDADDNATKKETVADLVTAMAGDGLGASSGVLAVQVGSNKGLALTSDALEITASAVASADLTVADDSFMFFDADGSVKEESFADYAAAIAGNGLAASSGVLAVGVDDATIELNSDALRIKDGGVDADALASSVAGNGLAGGGGTALSLDLNELSAAAVAVSADSIAIIDADDNSSKKETIADLATAMAGDGLAASSGVFAVQVGSNKGLALTSDALEITGSAVASADIAVGEDSFMFFDADGSVKEESLADYATAIAGNGLAASSGVLAVGVDDATIELNSDALRIKDGGVDADALASSVAGNGLAGGGGTALSLDLNELSAAAVAVAADSIAIIDADDNSSKKESIADLATAMAGNGLSAGSGAFALDLNELSAAAVAVAADSIAIIDADDNSSKKESIADLMTAVAGDGLAASSGVLAVGVDDSSLEINSDALRVKASGITSAMIADGAIVNADVNASAAIAATKLDFNVDLGGNVQFGTQSDDTVAFGGPIKLGGNAIADSAGNAVIQFDGSGNGGFAENMTVGGGYGSSGVTIQTNGAINADGALTIGDDGAGVNFTAHGGAANEVMRYDAARHILQFVDGSSSTMLTIGGDAASEFAVDVANGSDNKNKMRAAAFVTYSDESLKSDVTTMNTALDTVMSLEGVEFTWKDSGERDFGFIAQDVQSVLPKAVHTAGNGVQGVDYSRLTSVLVEAVKAQQVQIEELKALLKK